MFFQMLELIFFIILYKLQLIYEYFKDWGILAFVQWLGFLGFFFGFSQEFFYSREFFEDEGCKEILIFFCF